MTPPKISTPDFARILNPSHLLDATWMRSRAVALFALVSAISFAGTATSHATVLAVDFNRFTNAPEQQGGFEQFTTNVTWAAAGDSISQAFGDYTVTITAALGGGSGYSRTNTNTEFTDFEYRPLYRDGVQRLSDVNGLAISGLGANTAYTIQLWFYDPAGDDTMEFVDNTSGTPISLGIVTSEPIASGTASFPDRDAYSVIANVVTSASGELIFGLVGSNSVGRGKISGFELSPVPEPSEFALAAGLLALGVVGLRRRRC